MRTIKQNIDLIIIILLSLLIFIPILFNADYFINLYITENLNSVLLPVFGVFLGCLITSYTILVTLSDRIPNRVKGTKAYLRINRYFLLALYTLILKIIFDISFYFLKSSFVMIQIFLSIFSILMIAYLVLIIHKLISLAH